MTTFKKLNNLKYGIAAGLMATLITESEALAQVTGGSDVGGITDSLSTNLQTVPTLFSSAAYIMGTGFTIAGLFKLKEYVDDPTSGNMKNALVRLAIGFLLILLPFTISSSASTLDNQAAGVGFQGVANIP